MNKTPEEIKKGLETCIGECTGNKPHCPYHECGNGCMDTMNKNSLAYIQQLELNDSQVKKALSDNGFASLEAFLQAYNQVKKERDAAVADLYKMCGECACDTLCCNYCKYQEDGLQCHHDCKMYTKEWDWQWRGVREENNPVSQEKN